MGYGGSSMGYRIWNPVTRSVMVRRDVKFYENEPMGDQSKDANQEGIDLTVGLNSPKASMLPTPSEDQGVAEDSGTNGREFVPRRSERREENLKN